MHSSRSHGPRDLQAASGLQLGADPVLLTEDSTFKRVTGLRVKLLR